MSPSAEQLAGMAMQAHRAGQFQQAEEICRRVLESLPDHFKSLIHLSVLLRNQGRFYDSAALAERAIGVESTSSDGYVQMALSLLGLGQPIESIGFFQQAIALSPNLAPIHYHFGLALENVGRTEEAKAAFLDASRLDPRDVRARISLGALILTQENIAGARAQAEIALKLDPRSAEAHQLLAKVLVAEEKAGEAEESIRKSLELDPNSSYGHTMLGFRLLSKGEFAEAEKELRLSTELDPAQGIAFFGVTQARKIVESDRPFINQMINVIDNMPLTLEQAGYLQFGLGKAFDNLGEYERAMSHYDAAHRAAHLLRFAGTPFDELEYEREVEAIKTLYSPDLLRSSGEGFPSALPIMIVGMMRSGTTLTEQILSCHPAVGAGGEQWFWAKRGHLAHNLDQQTFDSHQATTLAREYCKTLRRVAPHSERITDKLPGNYLRLGMLHRALPNARIIHCRRNPVDTSLSIYFTANPVAPAYSHSKEGIAFVYGQYLSLMDHWRNALPPGRLHEIDYEDLVMRPEPVIRGMLDFLGLDWDEACLRHDMNSKDVRTPSLWQVRQPMYTTSVQRWRHYKPWLGAFKQLLDPLEQ